LIIGVETIGVGEKKKIQEIKSFEPIHHGIINKNVSLHIIYVL
jgi:hypothetical protein